MQIQLYPNSEVRLVWGAGHVPVRADEKRSHAGSREIDYGASGPLDIPPQPSQQGLRKARRRHPLSNQARHKILHHGGLFSDENKDRQVFLTGTLPGSTEEAMLEMTRLAPMVIKVVQTYLPRRLGLKGTELDYIWVWELQKRGALHFHAIVELPWQEKADSLVSEWHDIWCDCLELADRKSGTDIFERWYGGTHAGNRSIWQSRAEICKKSVSRYLSKYQSKGSKGKEKYYPPRWYGLSSSIRARMKVWVRENTINRFCQISPEVPMWAARKVCEEVLQFVCSGKVTHKHGYGDVGGVDCFGYAVEGVTVDSIMSYVAKALKDLGVLIEKQAMRLKAMDFSVIARRFARRIEAILPPDIYQEWLFLATEPVVNAALSRDGTTKSVILEMMHGWTYLKHIKGWKLEKMPLFAAEADEMMSGLRSRLDEDLATQPPG